MVQMGVPDRGMIERQWDKHGVLIDGDIDSCKRSCGCFFSESNQFIVIWDFFFSCRGIITDLRMSVERMKVGS